MIDRRVLRIRPRRIAAAARPYTAEEATEREARRALPAEIDALCHAWAHWCHTRRYYGPPDSLPSVIGQLRTRTSRATDGSGGPNALCSHELARFHLAVLSLGTGRERAVLELHYRYRPASIKQAAHVLGIGRQHWYTLRNTAARKAYSRLGDTFGVFKGDTLAQNSR